MTTQATHATPATPQAAPASPSEISDGIYAELCVIRRRMRPVVARISQLSTRGADLGPWTQTLRAAEQAALQLTTAIEAVPTPIWEPDTAYSSVIHVRDLTIDPEARRAWLGETDIPLTIREFDVLIAFARNPTRVIPKDELLRTIWGFRSAGRTRTVDTHVSRLRRKLVAAGADPRAYILSAWGVGWSLTVR